MQFGARARLHLGLILSTALWAAPLATAAAQTSSPPGCPADEDDRRDGKSSSGNGKKRGDGISFGLAGGCAKLSGSIDVVSQNVLWQDGGASPIIGSGGQPSTARMVNSASATATLETTRQTALGEAATAFELRWLKTSDDDSSWGSVSVQELKGSLAGWTAGYTDSLMNFWDGDFQFTATAPKRRAGIFSYEREIVEDGKLAIAVESGLPTSQQAEEGIMAVDFSSPLVTARWLYETDDLTLHLSGLLRRAEFPANPRVPFLPQTATTRTGWAASLGMTVPLRLIGEDDEASMQATYAVDASPFLGTSADVSTLASTVPTTGSARGWSVVGSIHHVWSEHWESNLFASYLTLDAELLATRPTVRTTRFGANLYWLPIDWLKLGAEIGYMELALSHGGAIGFLTGPAGRSWVGYLSAEVTF
jgi:hypothetical protein